MLTASTALTAFSQQSEEIADLEYLRLVTRSNDTNGTVAFAGPLQGWTSSPNGRGTIDIIEACFITIGLCAWTMLCLNVPPLDAP